MQYRQGGIKLIAWDNTVKASERYANGMSHSLNFRFRQYHPWLDQFSEPEAKSLWADQRLGMWLFGWLYLDQRLGLDGTIPTEIETFPNGSVKRKLAQRMLRLRREQGIDMAFSTMLCAHKDLKKIEASYQVWLDTHPEA